MILKLLLNTHNPNQKQKILFIFDDMIPHMLRNKKT